MEDWIDAIKDKVLADRPELPPGDWERFEADYLAPKRKRRVLPFVVALTSAAAAVFAAVLLINRPTPRAPISVEAVQPYVAEVSVDEPVPEVSVPSRVIPRTSILRQVPATVETAEEPSTVTETVDVVSEPVVPILEPETKVEPESVKEPEPVDRWPDVFEDAGAPASRKRVAFAPVVKGFHGRGNGPSYSGVVGSPVYGSPQPSFSSALPYIAKPDAFTSQHVIPLSFGIDFSVSIRPRLALTSGIDLSLYRSTFTGTENTGGMQFGQQAYYLGIPLRLEWTLWDQGRTSAWLGAGGKADYLVYGKFGAGRFKDNTVHWSAVGDLGVQYRLHPNVGLFLQPEVSYYFKPSAPGVETYRTEQPLTFSLGAGVRFAF